MKKYAALFLGVAMLALSAIPASGKEAPYDEFSLGTTRIQVLSLVEKDLKAAILQPATEAQRAAIARAYPEGAVRNFLNVLLLVGAVCGGQLLGYAAVSEVLTLIMYAKCIWNGSVAYNTPMYLCAAVYVAAYGMFIRASLGGRTWVSGAGK